MDYFRDSINNKVRKLRTDNNNLILDYIIIAEKHKKGGWHLHGVLSADFEKFIYLNKNKHFSLNCFDYLGFSSISEIRDKLKISSYITKYISKDFALREKNSHCYFCTQGLKRPVNIFNRVWANEDIKFDYENEYCSVKFTNITEILKFSKDVDFEKFNT